jgi:hypothetical protein
MSVILQLPFRRPEIRSHTCIAMLVAMVCSYTVSALSVSRPVQVFTSVSGEWVVRVSHSRMEPDTRSSVARWYQLNAENEYRRVAVMPLKNASAPGLAYITNRGALITLGDERDDVAEAVGVYSNVGQHLRSWPLDQLFNQAELACIWKLTPGAEISITNFWRSEEPILYFESHELVVVKDRLGGEIQINAKTGEIRVFSEPRETVMKAACSKGH